MSGETERSRVTGGDAPLADVIRAEFPYVIFLEWLLLNIIRARIHHWPVPVENGLIPAAGVIFRRRTSASGALPHSLPCRSFAVGCAKPLHARRRRHTRRFVGGALPPSRSLPQFPICKCKYLQSLQYDAH